MSVLSIDKYGEIWNGDRLQNQLEASDLPVTLASNFWGRLHAIDNRFVVDGTDQLRSYGHVSLNDVIPKLPEITEAVADLIRQVEAAPA